jgi:plasmid maintenance system killer protein
MPVSLFDARQKFVNFAVFLRFSFHYSKTKPQIEKMYSLRTKDRYSLIMMVLIIIILREY